MKMKKLVSEGKITKEKYKEFEKGTPKQLPTRVTDKKAPKPVKNLEELKERAKGFMSTKAEEKAEMKPMKGKKK